MHITTKMQSLLVIMGIYTLSLKMKGLLYVIKVYKSCNRTFFKPFPQNI